MSAKRNIKNCINFLILFIIASRDYELHSRVPERSFAISSWTGISWIAVLIFSLIVRIFVCQSLLQCLLFVNHSNNFPEFMSMGIFCSCKLFYLLYYIIIIFNYLLRNVFKLIRYFFF